jgi:hypothetical protein
LNKDNIGINYVRREYKETGYDEELESPTYNLESIIVSFFSKNNINFSGEYIIKTHTIPTQEEIKDKIIEVINS